MQRFETKYDLMNSAYEDKRIKKSAMALLQYLLHKSNKEQCFPAVETIAKSLGVCKRTVQYNMRKLESAGYIIRKDRWYNHQQLSNQYIFNFGIVDVKEPGYAEEQKYLDEDKNLINDTYKMESDRIMNKSVEILKVYNSRLSKYEKLVMIYIIHKANQTGICYQDIKEIMLELGFCKTTLTRLLSTLRQKGLILVKSKYIHERYLYIIKLVANTDTVERNAQKDVMNQRQEKIIVCEKFTKLIQEQENNLHMGFRCKFKRWLQSGFRKSILMIPPIIKQIIKTIFLE